MLLFLGDIEPVLQQDDAVVDNEVFEEGTAVEELFVFLLGAEPHYMLDPGAVVPAPVEDDDFPSRGQMLNVALRVDLRLLPLRRCRQGHQPEDTRAHALHDAFDDATLAGSVAALENDDDARSSLLHPLLKLDELDLQLEQLSLVLLVLHLWLFCRSLGLHTLRLSGAGYILVFLLLGLLTHGTPLRIA